MAQNDVLDYIRKTPHNSNVNVVKGMLNQIENNENNENSIFPIYNITINSVAIGNESIIRANYYYEDNKLIYAPVKDGEALLTWEFDLADGAVNETISFIVFDDTSEVFLGMFGPEGMTATVTGNCIFEVDEGWWFTITGDCTINIIPTTI